MATPTATFLGLLATALSAPERVLLDSMSSDLRFILSEFEIFEILQNDSDQSVPYYDDYKDMMIMINLASTACVSQFN